MRKINALVPGVNVRSADAGKKKDALIIIADKENAEESPINNEGQ